MITSFMARHGSRLLANGYTILPIAPGGKKPGRYQRGAWVDYPEWNRHAERPTTEVEVSTWSAWPDCGIGIVGGGVAAIDIDILSDPDLALQIEQLARARLGDTPALRIGRAPKRLLVYRTSAPFRGIRRAPLEVLCLGQQFVAYADHPDTGQPYAWPEEGLSELDLDSLPVIDADTPTKPSGRVKPETILHQPGDQIRQPLHAQQLIIQPCENLGDGLLPWRE